MQDITALVVRDAEVRARLEGYLRDAGFDVQSFEHAPPMAASTSTAVWVLADDEPAESPLLLRAWLVARSQRRAVIVTRSARAVRGALRVDEARFQILVPPVFPWQLVDAVRAAKAMKATKAVTR